MVRRNSCRTNWRKRKGRRTWIEDIWNGCGCNREEGEEESRGIMRMKGQLIFYFFPGAGGGGWVVGKFE